MPTTSGGSTEMGFGGGPIALGGFRLGFRPFGVGSSVGGYYPSELFASGEDGGVYDPSDLTSMFANSNGSGGNVAVGDPVGFILDKSQMGGRTAAQFIASQTNDAIGLSFTTVTPAGGEWVTDTNGNATLTGASAGDAVDLRFGPSTFNVWYQVRVIIHSIAGDSVTVRNQQGTAQQELSAPGTYNFMFKGAGGIPLFRIAEWTGTLTDIDLTVEIREIPGRHLAAPDVDQRPILRDEIVLGANVDVSSSPELNADFDAANFIGVGGAIQYSDSSWTVSRDPVSAVQNNYIRNQNNLELNKWYLLQFDIEDSTDFAYAATGIQLNEGGGVPILAVYEGGDNTAYNFNGAGAYSVLFCPTNSTDIRLRPAQHDNDTLITNLTLREVPASAARRYYLEGDGVDDCILGEFEFGPSGVATTRIEAYRNDGTFAGNFMSSTGNATGGGIRCINGDFCIFDGDTAAWVTTGLGNATTGEDYVITLLGGPESTAYMRRNGVAAKQSYAYATIDGLAAYAVFSAQYVSFNGGMPGRWYGSILIDRQLTLLELARAEAYLAAKSGVTLAPLTDDDIANLFFGGHVGGIYDPSDFTSMYVGRATTSTNVGDNPVVGDVVGTVLDKREMDGKTAAQFIASQNEIVTNGTFDTDVTGWSASASATIASVGGRLEVKTSINYQYAYQTITTVVGEWYLVTFDYIHGTTNTSDVFIGTLLGVGQNYGAAGSLAFDQSIAVMFKATATTTYLHFRNRNTNETADTTAYFDNISVKHIPGNHLVAPSDAARPMLLDELVDESVAGTGDEEVADISGLADGLDPVSAVGLPWAAYNDGFVTTREMVSGNISLVTTQNSSGVSLILSGANALDIGSWYELTWTNVSGDSISGFLGVGTRFPTQFSNSGRLIFSPTGATVYIYFYINGSGSGVFGDVSIKKISASAARRYHLAPDGIDDMLVDDSGEIIDPNEAYTTAVARTRGGNGKFHWSFGGTSSASRTGGITEWRMLNESTAYSALATGINDEAPRVYMVKAKPIATAANDTDSRMDGVDTNSIERETTAGDGAGMALFSAQTSSYNTGTDALFYGGVFIDRAVTNAERDALEQYLAAKIAPLTIYGIPTISGFAVEGQTLTASAAAAGPGRLDNLPGSGIAAAK
jgi:hypothetical protein